jgi:hypothetical protein
MLCHIIPRDNVIRFCVVLLCAAFILQAVALGKRGDHNSAGEYVMNGSPPLQMNPDITLSISGITLCSNSDYSDPKCHSFIKYMRVSAGFAIASFVSTPIAILIISAGVVRFASTTARMVVWSYLSVLFPFLATLICTIVFFTGVVANAGDPFGYGEATFHRGVSINCYIASTAIHCFGFTLGTIRLMTLLLVRPAQKQEMIQNKNIDSIMVLHMVNDDWERQKKVWKDHHHIVQKALEEEDGRADPAWQGMEPHADHSHDTHSHDDGHEQSSQVLEHTISTLDGGSTNHHAGNPVAAEEAGHEPFRAQ